MALKTGFTPVLNPLLLNNLEKLPVGSLDTIHDRVRLALLNIFLPRICPTCKPAFIQSYNKSQNSGQLLKTLCETCKNDFVQENRRKLAEKTKSNMIGRGVGGGKKGTNPNRACEESTPTNMNSSLTTTAVPKPRKYKKTKINGSNEEINGGFDLPITPPPSDDFPLNEKTMTMTTLPKLKKEKSEVCENLAPLLMTKPIFSAFEEVGAKWCRYCGTTCGSFWKSGPWGEKTLCNRHGCEYSGNGFARLGSTRLDLSLFESETRSDRVKPIIQEYCGICWESLQESPNEYYKECFGCPFAYHISCYARKNQLDAEALTSTLGSTQKWFCSQGCLGHFTTRQIKPSFSSKCRLPFVKQIPRSQDVDCCELSDSESFESAPTPLVPLKLRIDMSLLKNVKLKRALEQHNNEQSMKKRRKYRRDVNIVDRVIASVPVKVDHTVHKHQEIFVPRWNVKSIQERKQYIKAFDSEYVEEDLDDSVLLERHARYEYVERHMRLLQPGILNRLNSGDSVEKPLIA